MCWGARGQSRDRVEYWWISFSSPQGIEKQISKAPIVITLSIYRNGPWKSLFRDKLLDWSMGGKLLS